MWWDWDILLVLPASFCLLQCNDSTRRTFITCWCHALRLPDSRTVFLTNYHFRYSVTTSENELRQNYSKPVISCYLSNVTQFLVFSGALRHGWLKKPWAIIVYEIKEYITTTITQSFMHLMQGISVRDMEFKKEKVVKDEAISLRITTTGRSRTIFQILLVTA